MTSMPSKVGGIPARGAPGQAVKARGPPSQVFRPPNASSIKS